MVTTIHLEGQAHRIRVQNCHCVFCSTASAGSCATGSVISEPFPDRHADFPSSPGSLASLFCCGFAPEAAGSTHQGSKGRQHSPAGDGSSKQVAGKHKRTSLILLLTALVLLAASGMGAGVCFGVVRQTKQQRATAAEAAAAHTAAAHGIGRTAGAATDAGPVPPMNFQVVLAVPAVSADQGCRTWFSSNEVRGQAGQFALQCSAKQPQACVMVKDSTSLPGGRHQRLLLAGKSQAFH